MTNIRNIVVLTGAGISAESGIDTFRDSGGLWAQHRVEDVATPQGFARNPELVLRFYDKRREALANAQPNAAHRALARLDGEWCAGLNRNVLIITQNVDDLHERAASEMGQDWSHVLHMHGELKSALCVSCEKRSAWDAPMLGWAAADGGENEGENGGDSGGEDRVEKLGEKVGEKLGEKLGQKLGEKVGGGGMRPPCPICGAHSLRPDVVWFGEMPYQMRRITAAIRAADLFVSIGTSGAVYPAAGFVRDARDCGAKTLELNLEQSEGSSCFDQSRLGRASDLVPAWVDEMLAG